MVIVVLCLGVEFLCCLSLMYVFIFKLSLGNNCSLGFRYMFSWYKNLSVILVFFPHLGLLSGNFFLIAPFPDSCLLVRFSYHVDVKQLASQCILN